ncbi:uncharacterized protein LOC131990627 [Centropristis striata]|uniref:uncharacterized protein LOC131990627 n=1 Tax=Centropristis striata TaxID=184440 RepID=UPI0027E0A6C6|nr:uncharacterized protein LOC131990627 [Centropristis striata]XP_059211689.1 uncharacterized protein LOC131990627 [Centropristis striata]
MVVSRPLEHLLAAVLELRLVPGGDGFAVLDGDAGNYLPDLISSDEEGEYGAFPHGQVSLIESDEEEGAYWSDSASEDSGYGSPSEDEEDPFDEDIRLRSPLLQKLPPPAPLGALFPSLFGGQPPELPAQPSAPSTPGLTSTKRTREDSDGEQVGTKRQRIHPEEPAPSSSGLASSTKRTREDNDGEQVGTKRQRIHLEEPAPTPPAPRSTEEDYRDSAPSTSSGLATSTTRTFWLGPRHHQWDDDSDSDEDSW